MHTFSGPSGSVDFFSVRNLYHTRTEIRDTLNVLHCVGTACGTDSACYLACNPNTAVHIGNDRIKKLTENEA